ncbi:MAG: bifunctional oligoribonuclease/PAP phosphatase NrnA [Bacteroidales bacterium]|nr:bifunctional oligoribonuclease/PAP phosphatase NrnA [Bacteroidales bacterium]MDT8430563.1 bifunctional oligoribonuclease/PAP phosphatase NrnA [Bacteroidales bacterium]
MLNKQAKEKIRAVIEQKEPVVVISHINPDGDAIGSSNALALYLKKKGVPVDVIIPNEVPDFLRWMPGFDMVLTYKNNSEACKKSVSSAGTIFLVDFNDPGRMGKLEKDFSESTALRILIDHHENPVDFADVVISESWRGSAGEMIYLLMKEIDGSSFLDKDIATCLYVAIMTDTGNFRYGSSYAEIFNIAGELVTAGVDKDQIFTNVYDSYSEKRMKLLGYCMSEKMVVLPEYHAAYISLTREELKQFNHQVGDTEGIVNIPFSIKGIRVTALFMEKKDHVKISLRSKGEFSVDHLAAKYFRGGGHINAAGGEYDLPLDKTIEKFESILSEFKDELQ